MEKGFCRDAAVPVRSGFRGVFCAAAAAAATLLLGACEDRERVLPLEPGGDTTPPVIRFVAPTQDTTYTGVTQVVVVVHVTDRSGVGSVSALVSGGVAFAFPPVLAPFDTAVDIGYQIPTTDRRSDEIRFTVSAIDARQNAAPERVLRLVVH